MKVFTALFPFCGSGLGASGFAEARAHLFGDEARFEILGGIDNDAEGCADFELLTGAPTLCTDIAELQVDELVRFAGARAPDVVFLSPPCKGASGLLSAKSAASPKYAAMNQLALIWMRTMLAAWPDGPGLVLLENVPRLTTRAAPMLKAVRKLLRGAGYVLSDGYHDCGELGGLAQHRRRYLLVARHTKKVPPILYQPPKRRVRACGEVLGELPVPGTPEAARWGRLHELPRISWLNWVRLALIPAGGDWRDLAGVLAEGQERREEWARHGVADWNAPTGTVAGSGSNGVGAVADPRARAWYRGSLGVLEWNQPSGVVTGNGRPGSGPFSVADPRVGELVENPNRHWNKYRVGSWDDPAGAVIGATRPGSGAPAVADPRPFGNRFRVTGWGEPGRTVIAGTHPSNGGGSVADPRVSIAFDAGYAVLSWQEAARTIAGKTSPGCGAYAVADPRVDCEPRAGAYGVLSWQDAAATVTGSARVDNGRFAVADPRKPPPFLPIIIAKDGTWHRPLTTLELWALQSGPVEVNGKPVVLAGTSSSRWRERTGNGVPRKAGQAIGEQMLVTLLQAALGGFVLQGSGSVWVEPTEVA